MVTYWEDRPGSTLFGEMGVPKRVPNISASGFAVVRVGFPFDHEP